MKGSISGVQSPSKLMQYGGVLVTSQRVEVRQGKSLSARAKAREASACFSLSCTFARLVSEPIRTFWRLMSGFLDVPLAYHPLPKSNSPATFLRFKSEELSIPACFAFPFPTMAPPTANNPFGNSTPSFSRAKRAVSQNYNPP